jgi:hypothetical protein
LKTPELVFCADFVESVDHSIKRFFAKLQATIASAERAWTLTASVGCAPGDGLCAFRARGGPGNCRDGGDSAVENCRRPGRVPDCRRRRHPPRKPALAKIKPERPAPAIGPGTGTGSPRGIGHDCRTDITLRRERKSPAILREVEGFGDGELLAGCQAGERHRVDPEHVVKIVLSEWRVERESFAKREPRPNRRRAGSSGTLIGTFRGSQWGSGKLSKRIGLHSPDSSENDVTIEHRRAFEATARLGEEVVENNHNLRHAKALAVLAHSRTVPQGDGVRLRSLGCPRQIPRCFRSLAVGKANSTINE